MSGKTKRIMSRAILLVAGALFFAAQLTGCSESEVGELKENQAPTVWLSSAPPEGSVEKYTINMFWGGWDPDGQLAYFEYCITDNEGGTFDPADTTGAEHWDKVYANDSTFSFTADVLVDTNTTDLVTDFMRSHTFFIRSVDSEGLASIRPAYRSFTAYTLSPRVSIQVPRRVGLNPAQVPPITSYRWIAEDYISDMLSKQEPDSVSYLLESLKLHDDDWAKTIAWIRNLTVDAPEWGDWVWYQAPQDSGKFWTTSPRDFGNYMFAIRAMDEAGAITPVFDEVYNMRRVNVSRKSTGPILTVRNQYLGSVTTAVCNHPLTILDLPAGIPIEFSWTADASDYGGTEAGYRYGWDITDLNDPEQWEVDYTPFPPRLQGDPAAARSSSRRFFFGTHVFTIEVIDNSGFCSRIEVKVNIVQFTMSKGLLIIDYYKETPDGGWLGTGKGIEPNDEEHDRFWSDMVSNLEGFTPTEDVVDISEQGGTGVPLTKLADYKSIIWSLRGHVDMQTDFPAFHDLVKFRPKTGTTVSGKQQPNLVSLFLAAGGHMLISGQHPVSMAVDKVYVPSGIRYPVIWKYEIDMRTWDQTRAPTTEMIEHPPGDESFSYLDMCVETMDFAETSYRRRRGTGYNCNVVSARFIPADLIEYQRSRTMRAAESLNPNFPRLELRPETAGVGKAHSPDKKGLNPEVYNPQYFFDLCPFAIRPRDCFEPIYGLDCFFTDEPTFMQPIAFWTSTFANRIAEAPGAIPARSIVFGFPPVMCDTAAVRTSIEYVMFDEWQLPRK